MIQAHPASILSVKFDVLHLRILSIANDNLIKVWDIMPLVRSDRGADVPFRLKLKHVISFAPGILPSKHFTISPEIEEFGLGLKTGGSE